VSDTVTVGHHFVRSFVRSFVVVVVVVVGSFVRWFVGSLVRWFVGSLVRWFVLNHSFVHDRSIVRRSFARSFVR